MSVAILLVDHGSRRHEANAALDAMAALVRARAAEGTRVMTAHMELCAPSIAEAIGQLAAEGITELVVHPYFLGEGRHVTEDIPALVAAASAPFPSLSVRITKPLGLHALLAELVLVRVSECLALSDEG
jgi:sirohydrochlorin ferrochelatase